MRSTIFTATLALFVACPALRAAEPKAVIEKAIKAHGGADNLNKYKAIKGTVKGTITAMGQQIDVTGETIMMYPDKNKATIKLDAGGMEVTLIQIMNGDKLSVTANGMELPLMDQQLAEARASAYSMMLGQLTPLLSDKFTLKDAGESKLDGKTLDGVIISSAGQSDVTMYFDKESGLLMKASRKGRNAQGEEVEKTSIFSNYKEVNGIKLPGKRIGTEGGTTNQELNFESYEVMEKVDDSVFTIG